MSDAPLPEDIRGAWYFLDDDDGAEDGLEVLSLRIDGDFVRWEHGDGGFERADQGDYTFDGNFLILRGSNTKTYRVDVRSDVEWYLEGKKENRRLLRTRQDPSKARPLDEEELNSIRVRPTRVSVQLVGENLESPLAELVFETSDSGELPVGSLAVETVSDEMIWVGITALTDSIPDELWEAIVEESYLDSARQKPGDVETAEIEIVGTGSTFELGYQ